MSSQFCFVSVPTLVLQNGSHSSLGLLQLSAELCQLLMETLLDEFDSQDGRLLMFVASVAR